MINLRLNFAQKIMVWRKNMRKQILWNDGWHFIKQETSVAVTLPHTWNAQDGQDGGNDYYRGSCIYEKTFQKPETEGEVWLEFGAVAMLATVTVNGQVCAQHSGGYSTFRANITQALTAGLNKVCVTANNSYTEEVYPQKADFTFYGGIYRDVYLLCLPKAHFAVEIGRAHV